MTRARCAEPNPLTPFPYKEGGTEGEGREARGNLTPDPFPCGKGSIASRRSFDFAQDDGGGSIRAGRFRPALFFFREGAFAAFRVMCRKAIGGFRLGGLFCFYCQAL